MERDRRPLRALSRGAALRAALASLAALAAVLLLAALAWRAALVTLRGPRPEVGGRGGQARSPENRLDGGRGSAGQLSDINRRTGRAEVFISFEESSISGDHYALTGVRLRRVLDGRRGEVRAAGRRGVYHRASGGGELLGGVTVERWPPGARAPDLSIRTERLAWEPAGGELSSPERAEITWLDPRSGRKLVASGAGLVAERWTQRVRLLSDVRMTLEEPVMPRRAAPGRRAEAGVAVLTCDGPAVFEQLPELGARRVTFSRRVAVARGGDRLTCDELELQLCSERPRRPPAAAAPEAAAVEQAAAGPLLSAAATRWLTLALEPPAAAAREPLAPAGRPGGLAAIDAEYARSMDSVTARGGVTISAPEGTARGELAFYDRPAESVWLEGGADEPAEVVRGADHMMAPAFFFNLRTEEMCSVGGGRARVIVSAGER